MMERTSAGDGDGAAEENSGTTAAQKDTLTMTTGNEQDSNPFEEYMWMGDPEEEDEVNLQVMEEILEEEFIESCFEDMLEEEALGLFSPPSQQEEGTGDDVPALHSLSIDSGAVSDVEIEGVLADGSGGGVEDRDASWSSEGDVEPPSGFAGQNSDGESENSDTDSQGDTPQR